MMRKSVAKKSTKKSSSSKLWGSRFREETEKKVEAFTSSLSCDIRLARYDIQGSYAHCRALAKVGVLSREEEAAILKALNEIAIEIETRKVSPQPGDEDIHTFVERRLIEKTGEAGRKLRTARSRNDQIATDIRLYLKEEIMAVISSIEDLQKALVKKAKEHIEVIMPGYTHLQRAQPLLFSHHLLAYYEMLERDQARLHDTLTRVNVLPLGSGPLAGTNYPVDRYNLAGLLGFHAVSFNSVDAVSDRDFVIEFLGAASILMMHLSRLCEELVVWSSREFHFIELPDAYCTGSSAMPQKKNPDVPELIRGKTGRVYGNLMAVLTVMKSLPLSYNRDMQEDKEPLFDSVTTALMSVEMLTGLIRRMTVKGDTMKKAATEGYLVALDIADYLVEKGIPFAQAHHVVGKMVTHCLDRNKEFSMLTLQEFRKFSPAFDKDVFSHITLEKVIERKNQVGGTARARVLQRIKEIEKTWE